MNNNSDQINAIARIMGDQKSGHEMTFGKYKGRDLSEIPLSYLKWVSNEIPDDELVDNCEKEIFRRTK